MLCNVEHITSYTKQQRQTTWLYLQLITVQKAFIQSKIVLTRWNFPLSNTNFRRLRETAVFVLRKEGQMASFFISTGEKKLWFKENGCDCKWNTQLGRYIHVLQHLKTGIWPQTAWWVLNRHESSPGALRKKKAKVIVLADLISDKSHRSNMLLKLDYDNKFYFLLYLKGGFSHYYSHKGL